MIRRWQIERQVGSTGMDLATWWEPLEAGYIYSQRSVRRKEGTYKVKSTFFTKWGAERHMAFLRTLGFRVLRVVKIKEQS